MSNALKITLLLCFILVVSGKNWAFLVAGSEGYTNYRHQSDIYHSYQVVKANGIPEENIILMAYDDIAMDKKNPFPGKIFNHPDGKNVYEGVKIDYKGKDVNPENFLAILQGKKESVKGGTGRVIESTSDDNIFVYFSDHGGFEVLTFPHGALYKFELDEAIDYLYENKRYKKMVFYIESCESGSMFEGLKPEKNIYATTASDPDELSMAIYCGDDATVNGTKINSCLGDEYSVSWMEHSDAVDLWSTKVGQQFDHVKKVTKGSTPCEYGDLSIRDDMLGDYQGHKEGKLKHFLGWLGELPIENKDKYIRISSRDVKLLYLKNIAEISGSPEDYDAYYKEIEKLERSKEIFRIFNHKFKLDNALLIKNNDFNCYKKITKMYSELCGFDADIDLKYFRYLSNFCSLGLPINEAFITFNNICNQI